MSVSAPFLVLDDNKKMMLLPLTLLHKEAPDPVNISSWTEVPNVSTKAEFPLQKWVHVGCEVIRSPKTVCNRSMYLLLLDLLIFLVFLGF